MRKMKLTPSLLLVLVLMLSMTIGTTYAKYATQKEVEGTVNITAELGTIAIVNGDNVENYSIIPGVDIAITDAVQVSDKSAIPAYVYLVVDTDIEPNARGVNYTLADCWQPVTGHAGVYVYCDDEKNPIEVTTDVASIPILNGNSLTVSQYVKSGVTSTVYMNFTAYMFQTASGADAAKVYNNNPIT